MYFYSWWLETLLSFWGTTAQTQATAARQLKHSQLLAGDAFAKLTLMLTPPTPHS
jgi:hypothetical protein